MRAVWVAASLGCAGSDAGVVPPEASATAVPQAIALEPGSRFDASGFVEAPGRELVIAHCTACHSGKLVQQNRATRHGWRELIGWMQKKQGLWVLTPAVESSLLDYLATYYGPDPESAAQRRPPLPDALMPPLEARLPERR